MSHLQQLNDLVFCDILARFDLERLAFLSLLHPWIHQNASDAQHH